MKHNKKGEKEKIQNIAISIIKSELTKGNYHEAIDIAYKNGISSERFGEIVKELNIVIELN